jgi:AraC family transcriptional regulator of adaptative response/methylated-DNA-[protein]-cysteine methyltransferase
MLDTLRNITIEPGAITVPDEPHSDYERVRRIIAFISERWREQPTLEAIADHVGLSTTHVHHLFRRWAGLSPKAFLQAITLDNAKALLADSASVLDATYELGLSGPARLHDLFVTHEAMTPGDYKAGGAGLTMRFGFHPLALRRGGADRHRPGSGRPRLRGRRRPTRGAITISPAAGPRPSTWRTRPPPRRSARRIFSPSQWQAEQPLRVVLIGTDFEVRVWQTLLRIPRDRATTYSDIARHIGKPAACRAVGAAVGKNPVSFVVPCHRVLGRSGALTATIGGSPASRRFWDGRLDEA